MSVRRILDEELIKNNQTQLDDFNDTYQVFQDHNMVTQIKLAALVKTKFDAWNWT